MSHDSWRGIVTIMGYLTTTIKKIITMFFYLKNIPLGWSFKAIWFFKNVILFYWLFHWFMVFLFYVWHVNKEHITYWFNHGCYVYGLITSLTHGIQCGNHLAKQKRKKKWHFRTYVVWNMDWSLHWNMETWNQEN